MPGIASSAPAVLIAPPAAAQRPRSASAGRRDAAQPRAAGGGRAVRHAGGALPGPHRPGDRPRAGHRPASPRLRCAGRWKACRRTTSRCELADLSGCSPARTPGRSITCDARAGVTCRRSGCWVPAGSARSWPRLRGLPFPFAHHFSAVNTVPALALYRQYFRPSQWLQRPHAMVAVSAICADTDEAGVSWLAGAAGAVVPAAAGRHAAAAGSARRKRRRTRTRLSTGHSPGSAPRGRRSAHRKRSARNWQACWSAPALTS